MVKMGLENGNIKLQPGRIYYYEDKMMYRTKEENRIKRKLTRTKRKKISLQNEVAVLNLNIAKTNNCNLILRREIILKDIRELDLVISEHYGNLRSPSHPLVDICMYGIVEAFPDLGTRT